jgi:hypothetical protein
MIDPHRCINKHGITPWGAYVGVVPL